ncbi:trefoil factor 1 [Callithrix jacchus]|uniref:trefoil factor 1 n=1 Tax=Callithrix jacchus TaxID=9483 RepID=UPI0004F09346|nr:trefoil factor 1 [Callithrix jacchus]
MEYKVICALVLVSVLALSTLVETQSETCAMAPQERKNCGFPGVTASQCASKGCCFDDTILGVPWCFTPKTIDVPSEDECEF